MTTTLTNAQGTTVSPDLVVGFSSTRQSRTVVQDVIGKQSPDVYVFPASTRSGTLQYLFASEAASKICEDMHTTVYGQVYLQTTDRSTVSLTYVVDGNIVRELDDTRSVWLVSVDFREVTA